MVPLPLNIQMIQYNNIHLDPIPMFQPDTTILPNPISSRLALPQPPPFNDTHHHHPNVTSRHGWYCKCCVYGSNWAAWFEYTIVGS
mmetsp:Transcript_21419/g.61181  ORF Transcript_21419/g.61181 Transcript_21419/m.61181 type:complete len:86 (-) Transcript_21419:679-936(-)